MTTFGTPYANGMSTLSEKTAEFKRRTKKFLWKLAAVITVLLFITVIALYYLNYSTGVRAGVVLKVSKRGAIFKTYEGQLDLMSFGAVKSQNQLSQTFEFSIYRSDKDVINTLEQVALSGQRVNLRYEEKYAVLPWRGSTKYFVVGVDVLDGSPPVDTQKRGFLE